MTKKTLKDLIEIEFDRCSTISEFKSEVFRLIDLYESDSIPEYKKYTQPDFGQPTPYNWDCIPDEVPYSDTCPCNPKNGGSGICGCIMGNKLVPNPKKYGYPKINTTSTGTKITSTI